MTISSKAAFKVAKTSEKLFKIRVIALKKAVIAKEPLLIQTLVSNVVVLQDWSKLFTVQCHRCFFFYVSIGFENEEVAVETEVVVETPNLSAKSSLSNASAKHINVDKNSSL